MEAVLLSLHVVAGILFIGPVAVAVSLFPRFAPQDSARPSVTSSPDIPSPQNATVAWALHRITRVYGALGLFVPVVGTVLASVQSRLGEPWIILAMILTAVAGALLVLRIAPAQRDALASPETPKLLRRIGMLSGLFNLLWVGVVVMMIVRPGAHF